MKYPQNPLSGQYLDPQAAAAFVKQNGTTKRPRPPRNLQATSGSRSVLVTWDAPDITDGIIGYKVYTNNENSLLATIRDPNVRQYTVPASAGSAPPKMNVFISAISQSGESVRVQIQGSATVEAGAPAAAQPPAGSAAGGTTGSPIGGSGGGTNPGRPGGGNQQ